MKLRKMRERKKISFLLNRRKVYKFSRKNFNFCHVKREKIFVKNLNFYFSLTYDSHWRFFSLRNILVISAVSVNMINFYSRSGESGFAKRIRRALRVFKYISSAKLSSVQRYVNERLEIVYEKPKYYSVIFRVGMSFTLPRIVVIMRLKS